MPNTERAPSSQPPVERVQRVQDALYRIAEAASAAQDMHAFYATIHEIVAELMYARNLYIALYDDERERINFPYYVDEVDEDLPDPRAWEPFGIGNARGLTGYVLRSRRPELFTRARWQELVDRGEIEAIGEKGEDWLGVPLLADDRVIGIVVVQTYAAGEHYSEQDLDVLTFVGQHIASALTRARAIEETRERNAELALINEIGEALAKQLDFAAIIELVGDRVRSIFSARGMFIALYHPDSQTLTFPYDLDEGEPFDRGVMPFGNGITSTVIRTGRSLRLSTIEEQEAAGAIQVGGSDTQSWLGVPIKTAERVIGVVGLESLEAYAFSEADERLLTTLASSMGVALENARLFGETKRLLAETDQRAAELAVINEIGAALAEQLEFTAIIELVGERIRTLFEARSSYIALYDGATGVISFPWEVEGNERLHTEPFDLGPGLTSEVIRTRKSLLLRTSAEAQARGAIQFGPTTETWLGVPILAGDRVLGVIALESAMASAYDDSDERLLSTLASSMGVALENARLFDETKRLLAETDERAAELAIINGVQQGLAAQLDLQAMYDLVGDKIQEIFDAQVVDFGIYDFDAGVVHYPYTIERGLRFPDEPTAISAMTLEFIEARTPLVINDVPAWEEERGEIPVIQGEPALSIVRVPLMVGGDVRGGISLQNLDRTDAFSDDDIRLLSTLAGSLSVALENARLFGETKRLLTETDERAAELAIINEVQRGLAERLDMVAMYEVVGGKIQEIFDAQVVDIGIVDREADQIRFPYTIERGVRFPDEPMAIEGPRAHVLQTRELLVFNEDASQHVSAMGQTSAVLQGEPARSVVYAPLVVGNEARGVISLQNLDRENAFSDGDVRLLTTLAASLSVALENARLIHETRRRVAELDTVNQVGQAIAAQLDPAALLEMVGEQMRQTFAADIVFVALLDEPASAIQFPYYFEHGAREPQPPLPLGQGLTSRILMSREPLLLNKASQFDEIAAHGVGTPALSWLGVPILVGDEAIGVISVQSTQQQGRFGEDDVRLLGTIAANVGVAIQNARLYDETHRRAEEMAALADVGREISATLDPTAVLESIAEHTINLLSVASSAVYLAQPDGHTFRAIVAHGRIAEQLLADTITVGEGIIGSVVLSRESQMVNDVLADPRTRFIPGTDPDENDRLMVALLIAHDAVIGAMAVWRPSRASPRPS